MSKEPRMQISMEQERVWRRVLRLYHAAIVPSHDLPVAGRDGQPIKPMGVRLAAEAIGLTPTDMANRLNPNLPTSRPTLEGFLTHLLLGMDRAPLDEIEAAIGRVAIDLPPAESYDDADLVQLLARACREHGEWMVSVSEALADGRIEPNEYDRIGREANDAFAAIAGVLQALRAKMGSARPVVRSIGGRA